MFLPPIVPSPKITSFEYVLNELLNWYHESQGTTENNDLSVLKSMKLLFFVTAANSSRSGFLINNTFNDFRAMPYGHVESEIYNYIRQSRGKLSYFEIDNKTTKLLPEAQIEELNLSVPSNVRSEIQTSISALKLTNPELILYSAFELVELSHSWESWKKNIEIAKSNRVASIRIEAIDVINEQKNYIIYNF